MTSFEIVTLVIIVVCLLCLCIAFTFLFRHYFMTSIRDINEGKEDIYLVQDAVSEDRKSKSRARKVWKIAGKILSNVIFVLVLLLFALGIYSRVTGNVMVFGNTSYIAIASGSMSEKYEGNTYLYDEELCDQYDLDNQIQTYDIIGITKYDSVEDVKLYDVVAYKASTGDTIVHRIIEIKADGQYITRGDANEASDTGSLYTSYLSYSDIVGYYNGTRVGGIGSVIVFFQSNAGIATVVALLYCYLMFEHFSGKYDDAVGERTEMLLDVLNYDLEDDPDVALTRDANEALVYRGERYLFEDGEFVKKEPSDQPYSPDGEEGAAEDQPEKASDEASETESEENGDSSPIEEESPEEAQNEAPDKEPREEDIPDPETGSEESEEDVSIEDTEQSQDDTSSSLSEEDDHISEVEEEVKEETDEEEDSH